MLRAFAFFIFVALTNVRAAQAVSESPTPTATAPVDQLIPWLLDEDRQLRGIAFSKVIFDTTGKSVLAVDPKNEADQRVIKRIAIACDETMKNSAHQ